MSEYEIICKRVGQRAADRLASLGLLEHPSAAASSKVTLGDNEKRVSSRDVGKPAGKENSGSLPAAEVVNVRPAIMTRALQSSIDTTCRTVVRKLDPARRAEFGQYMTPPAIAEYMASLFTNWSDATLLEPAAGVGALAEAFAERFFRQALPERSLTITAYEIEPLLADFLQNHLVRLDERATELRRDFRAEALRRDFLVEGSYAASMGSAEYSHVILNPPYGKIANASNYRRVLRRLGIETVNLYSAFLALSVALTKANGEIVAIVPRSFCNGAYFQPFREWLLKRVAIERIHVFDSRTAQFSDDDVLQENIVIKLVKTREQREVAISRSSDSTFGDLSVSYVPFERVVHTNDRQRFIHVPTRELEKPASLFTVDINELGLTVSTGPVVDFRLRRHCFQEFQEGAAPLLYSHHFKKDGLQWPKAHKKPNAIAVNDETAKWLMPSGWYVLTKRFSAKEERRRITAYSLNPADLPYQFYGVENHLNIIHCDKHGIDPDLARGLTLFLNSTIFDDHFRSFSGHTQVNATDLRSMKYPRREVLVKLGCSFGGRTDFSQSEIDAIVEAHNDTRGS